MALTLFDASQIALFSNTFVGFGRNRILNGDMTIDQQNGGGTVTINSTSGNYGPDGFQATGQAADGVFTLIQSTSTPPTGFQQFLRVSVTTADASVAAAQVYRLYQLVEGSVVRDFLGGTANAKTFTVSFWVRSSLTGTFGGSITNGPQGRSWVFNYTISAANTWQQVVLTLTGDTTSAWPTDTNPGMRIFWDIGSGSNSEAAAGSWGAGLFYRSSGNTRLISTNAATLDITGVQIEIGSVATNFEYRHPEVELALCQRYYEKSYPIGTAVGSATTLNDVFTITNGGTGQSFGSFVPFKVTKRTNPTISLWTTAGTSGKAEWGTLGAAFTERVSQGVTSGGVIPIHGFSISQAVNATDNGCAFHYAADARL